MNLYQLVPTSCYDDVDGGNSDLWICGTPEDEDGRTSRSGFYGDVVDDSGGKEMGWYNVVGQAAVPPVPHLLSLDAEHLHLRFFDDDSSAENETFFGRMLDTISEEDEDDLMERVAETDEVEEARYESSLYEDHRSADLAKLDMISVPLTCIALEYVYYIRCCMVCRGYCTWLTVVRNSFYI